MRALYVSASGKYYVTYESLHGTYDVREWPSQDIVGNRDMPSGAVELMNHLEQERR